MCRFRARGVRVIVLIDQEPEELLSPYWSSYVFGRIDALNVTIVFSAGVFNTDLRQPGRQGQ